MARSEAPHVRGFLFADLRGYTQFAETNIGQSNRTSVLLTRGADVSKRVPLLYSGRPVGM